MRKGWLVNLTDEERVELGALTRRGKAPARNVAHARVLLLASQGRLTDHEFAAAMGRIRSLVERTRKRFVLSSLDVALCSWSHGLGPFFELRAHRFVRNRGHDLVLADDQLVGQQLHRPAGAASGGLAHANAISVARPRSSSLGRPPGRGLSHTFHSVLPRRVLQDSAHPCRALIPFGSRQSTRLAATSRLCCQCSVVTWSWLLKKPARTGSRAATRRYDDLLEPAGYSGSIQ
jgi:hypothetical protein